mmetsp:Transcript_42874/g.91959  ORF Transcript_42874/g.91959 Transcript_42874/m.91959 type:complete len:597 (+) Transcript_42874:300-2090(+)|eukprot:CAMPEP_0206439602 /NCGR_PEP_ID=MMETSP0324_2-20121206/12304_1 /ASSEMBLY_ACC=CAM_ASM_000836 /TAXON_ID=2866 /ORGANISM="Crypthecodinium cohnii, Strain Seligo" /LENGTH=596 /DNA_ID=CAMNT_0053907245 /DNA_START=211 /DNA_END=2001 /DNA_ORIENTATION=+
MGQCSAKDVAVENFEVATGPLEVMNVAGGRAAASAARYHVNPSKRLSDDYIVEKHVLGQGLCGDVVLAIGRADGRRYALKTVSKQNVSKTKLAQLNSEVEIYLLLDHPNIACLHDVYESDTTIQLLTECCDGGELYFRLQKRGVYAEADAAEATRHMLRAVGYLHAHNVVHRDLKLENFLYESVEDERNKDVALKLIDFGFAKLWDRQTPMTASCGSIAYVSPDVLLGRGYDHKCDLWSVGVIVWMLLVGYPPFHGDEKKMMSKIKGGQPDWSHRSRWRGIPAAAVEFVQNLLEPDAARRPDAQEALRHRWLCSESPRKPTLLGREALRSLKDYAAAPKVKRAALQLLARELSPEETSELRELFLSLDRSNTGTISMGELKDAIRSLPPKSPSRRRLSLELPAAAISKSAGDGEHGSKPVSPHRREGHDGGGSGSGSPAILMMAPPPSDLSPLTPARALVRATSEQLEEVLSYMQVDGQDEVFYSHFLAAMLGLNPSLREGAARVAFNRLDVDRSGIITASDLRQALGETFEGMGVESLLASPSGRTKQLGFEDFLAVLQGSSSSIIKSPDSRRRSESSRCGLQFFPDDTSKDGSL